MSKFVTIVLTISLFAGLQMGCNKQKDTNHSVTPTPAVTSALADTLRATCIAPFVGRGDTLGLYLPTAFTPNGDGLNDVYSLIGYNITPGYFTNLTVKIYDTTGVLVYETAGPNPLAWDGIDKNTDSAGKKYKYYVRLKYTTAGNITDSGSAYLYLLRGTTCITADTSDFPRFRFPSQFDITTGYVPTWNSYETFCF